MNRITLFLLLLISAVTQVPNAEAADTLVYDNTTTCVGWGPGTTQWTFKMNATANATISAIEMPMSSLSGQSSVTLRIISDSGGAPSTVLGVFNYDATTSTASLARFLGTANVTTGTFYWQYYATSTSFPCANNYTNLVAASWSAFAVRYTSSNPAGPFTFDAGGGSASALQLKIYTSVPDTTPPSFLVGNLYSIAENETAVATIRVSESSTISLSSGVDQGKFRILQTDSTTANLSLATAPNFEVPTDSGADNTYQVGIRASDAAGNSAYMSLTVTVTNVDENARVTSYTINSAPIKGNSVNIVATVNFAGRVTFLANSKRIPKCINIPTVGSGPITATCGWKPATKGAIGLTFSVVPTAANNYSTTSAPAFVTVGSRPNLR